MAKHKHDEPADAPDGTPAPKDFAEQAFTLGVTISEKRSAPEVTVEVRTPREWAEALGNIVKGDPRIPQARTFPSMEHAVADHLHGWSQHEHHYQSHPLKISKADYEKALEAACNQKTKVPAPHAAALSPTKMVATEKHNPAREWLARARDAAKSAEKVSG